MRTDLQTLENIEAYLTGSMKSPQLEIFENEVSDSQELQEAIDLQKLIQQAIIRKSLLSQVQQFSPASVSSISMWTRFKLPIILSSFLLAGLIGLGLMISRSTDKEKAISTKEIQEKSNFGHEEAKEEVNSPLNDSMNEEESSRLNSYENEMVKNVDAKTKNTTLELDGLKTWITPNKQIFDIDPEISNTIECENGTLIIVPENAFCDKNGVVIKSRVKLEVVEALNVADMIAYNLTTMSDGKALQSGGMLYIQPTVEGEHVFIQKDKPLLIEVPTNEIVPGMVAWKGEVNEKGDINWVNPKELAKFLIPVDFKTLDFLPAGFDAAVAKGMPYKNHVSSDRELKDSLYYSLGLNRERDPILKKTDNVNTSKGKIINGKNTKVSTVINPIVNVATAISFGVNDGKSNQIGCFINPSSIKAIKEFPFLNTLLATKEFEERLKVLHEIPDAQDLFDLYVNNLTKNLYEIDQLVANELTDQNKVIFQNFANQKLTNVDNKNINQEKIKEFYNSSRAKYQNEVITAQKLYKSLTDKELEALQEKFNALEINRVNSTAANNANNLGNSRRINFPNISLGANRLFTFPTSSVANMNSYKVAWNSTGWMNIDEYLHLLGNNDAIVSINPKSSNPDLKVYQCINTLKTIIPLIETNGKMEAHFPKIGNPGSFAMKDTYCVGIHKEGEQLQYAEKSYNPYQQKNIELEWNPVSQVQLEQNLRKLSPINEVLINGLKKQQQEALNESQYRKEKAVLDAQLKLLQDAAEKENKFIQSLINAFDPCGLESKIIDPMIKIGTANTKVMKTASKKLAL
jgi:hypothetical protein